MNIGGSRLVRAARLVLMPVFGVVLSTPAMAQEWDSAFGRTRMPEAWANSLLEYYDLVAVGRFRGIPDFSGDVADLVSRQNLVAMFDIGRIYKGSASNGSTIAVQVPNDMLAYPGENISRYAWRLNYQVEHANAVAETMNQRADLDRRFEDGAVGRTEYNVERERLDQLLEEQLANELPVQMKVHFSIHSQSFYDLDGAIVPDAEYLVALDTSPDEPDSYTLVEFPRGKPASIYWGVMAEDVIDALDGLAE